MNSQERKFRLFARLQELGFTYDEAVSLRRIEMTLQRWAELECGNDRGAVERDETTGKPRFYYDAQVRTITGQIGWVRKSYPVADREKGALRRLAKIVSDRNTRNWIGSGVGISEMPSFVSAYSQGDCRGCMLTLITREQLTDKQTGALLPIDQHHTRGLAVCA